MLATEADTFRADSCVDVPSKNLHFQHKVCDTSWACPEVSCHNFTLLTMHSMLYWACSGVYSLSDKTGGDPTSIWVCIDSPNKISSLFVFKEVIALEINPMFFFPASDNNSFSTFMSWPCLFWLCTHQVMNPGSLCCLLITEASEQKQEVNF